MERDQLIHIDSYERRSGLNPASLIFAHAGDIFISTEYDQIDRGYLDYLAGLENNHEKKAFPKISDIDIQQPRGEGRTTAMKALNDSVLLASLKQKFQNSNPKGLTCFATISEIRPKDGAISQLAHELEIPLLSGDHEIILNYGGKVGSRKLFKSLELLSPSGVEDLTADQIRAAWKYFHLVKSKGFWIKANWGVAEHRNIYIPTFMPLLARDSFEHLSEKYEGNFVVEDHIADAVSFPGALIDISDKGIHLFDVHEQSGVGIGTIFEPDAVDKKRYTQYPFAGAPFWWKNNEISWKFRQDAEQIGRRLRELGWRGTVCVDGIVDKTGNIFWDEINFRKGGSSFVVEVLRRLYDLSDSQTLEDDGVTFLVEHIKTNNLSFQQMAEKLHKFQFNHRKKRGIIIVNGEYFRRDGFDMVGVADVNEFSDIKDLLDEAKRTIKEFIVQ